MSLIIGLSSPDSLVTFLLVLWLLEETQNLTSQLNFLWQGTGSAQLLTFKEEITSYF